MENQKTYSIEELAALSGITRRTVRFYIQKGLLPPPLGVGRGKHYTDEHLEKIFKIKALQREGIILDKIETIINNENFERTFETEMFEKRIVIKIKLIEGISLEIHQGTKVPSPGTLREIIKLLKQTT